jgi:hypothetical protein
MQFVSALADRKRAALTAARAAAEPRFRRDYTRSVALMNSKWSDDEPCAPTWRRLRVSGGISLRALQDKVLAPALGWCRNYHCYVFTDRTDGAQFGPKDSGSIDLVRPCASACCTATCANPCVAAALHGRRMHAHAPVSV